MCITFSGYIYHHTLLFCVGLCLCILSYLMSNGIIFLFTQYSKSMYISRLKERSHSDSWAKIIINSLIVNICNKIILQTSKKKHFWWKPWTLLDEDVTFLYLHLNDEWTQLIIDLQIKISYLNVIWSKSHILKQLKWVVI